MAEPVRPPVDEDTRMEHELREAGLLGHDWIRPVQGWAWMCARCFIFTHEHPSKATKGALPGEGGDFSKEIPKTCSLRSWDDKKMRAVTGCYEPYEKMDKNSSPNIYYEALVKHRKEHGYSAP